MKFNEQDLQGILKPWNSNIIPKDSEEYKVMMDAIFDEYKNFPEIIE